jgi:NADH-quinone oxidoreductase subunit G
MAMITLSIDDKRHEVDGSQNLLATCLSLGLNLPYFCWHPALHSVGACRQCAILKYKDAEDKKGKLVMACLEAVTNGMRISIEAPEARRLRAANVEALMVNHPHDCPVCDEGGECHLQDMTVMTGHNCRRYRFTKRTHINQYLGPFVNHEMNRCIQCYRCVRFYKNYAGGKDLDVFSAHDDVYFGRQEDGVLENEFSGNLVEVCPTGVFTDKTLKKHFTRKWDMTDAPSICHQCGLGCNIIASERYGSLRRILSRFNGDVNGYFLCDRGRFGYEYVNSRQRILAPTQKRGVISWVLSSHEVIRDIHPLTASGKKMIGIGSPKASLESNFLLRELVGAENFYAGIPNAEGKLIRQVIDVLKSGKVKIPSLAAVKEYDAVFIIGEDVTNTAPLLALNLRQAAKNKPGELAAALKIPIWNDAAVREVVQGATGPFFIATPAITRLDEVATQTYRGTPDNIARLAYAVAFTINHQFQPEGLDEPTKTLSQSIATALLAAKKPLIVAGASLFNEAIIDAAAFLAYALKDLGKDAGLVFTVPEVNSIGLSLLAHQFLDDAFERAAALKEPGPGPDDIEPDMASDDETAIILENDLYERTFKCRADAFFNRYRNVIVLDYLQNATTRRATWLLPAGTFAETDGTVINNEGRAQRFYAVHVPDNEVRGSWKWLLEMVDHQQAARTTRFDDITERLVKAFPALQAIQSLAPPATFREGTQKIPREPHRYSGRTAMHADIDVSEPMPPADPDSALSFTMEGYEGVPPPGLTPFYWSPGWNSVQAINKYQIEVGGPLHGGNPGKRLFDPVETDQASSASGDVASGPIPVIPPPFSPLPGECLVIPLYHIFGSDELSALSPGIQERAPQPYIALNASDAEKSGLAEGSKLEMNLDGVICCLPVRLQDGLAPGTAGLPRGLKATAGIAFPFWITLNGQAHD